MPDERRLHSRIAFHAPASLLAGGDGIAVVVLDLSLRGAMIELPEGASLAAGTSCALRVQLAELSNEITMETSVAYIDKRCAGLLCQSIDLDSVSHLRRLVELNLGDPQLLERELSALISR